MIFSKLRPTMFDILTLSILPENILILLFINIIYISLLFPQDLHQQCDIH